MQVRVYENIEAIEGLTEASEELLAQYPGATIFCTWEWLAAWWRAYRHTQKLYIAAFFEPPHKLVGLAALAMSTRRLMGGFRARVIRLLGDGSDDSDNLDMPVRPGYEKAFVSALLDWLEDQAPRWDICEFNTLPANSAAGESLRKQLKLRNWDTFCSHQLCSVVPLPDSWDSYRRQLSSEDCHNLDRYQRRLERRYRVRFYKCTEESELASRLETLFRLHGERWKVRGEIGVFENEARRRFYGEMSRSLLARGRLEFWFLELNEKPVAAQFGMRYEDCVFQLQEGFDPHHHSDRVGFLLRAHVVQQLIADGISRYHFLAGQSAHKFRWGAKLATYCSIRLAHRRSAAAFYLRCVHHSTRTKQLLRAHVSQRTWEILHRLNYKLGQVRINLAGGPILPKEPLARSHDLK